jgi:CrcB protein
MVGCGGFLGANLRYWLGGLIQNRAGSVFPIGTLAVNVSGSFVLGALLALALRENWSPGWRLFLGVGLLGGYTTFSTFSQETVGLLGDGSHRLALLYVLGNVILGILGAWLGIVAARSMAGG